MPKLEPNKDLIQTLKDAHRGELPAEIWAPLEKNKLNVVKLVYKLFQFDGLKEAKDWCDRNIFEN